jgi:hypothetical protein
MKEAAAERGTRPCTGLPMPVPPRPAGAAMKCHETMPPPHHAAARLVPPPHHTANSPRPPPVPLAEREPTLHIPDDVLRHLRRGDGTLLGAPPPLLQPLVLEAAAPHLLKAATARAGGSCGRGCNPSGGGCNPMCGGCTPMCARGCTAIPWHVHVPMACAHGMCPWHVPMACAHGMCPWHVHVHVSRRAPAAVRVSDRMRRRPPRRSRANAAAAPRARADARPRTGATPCRRARRARASLLRDCHPSAAQSAERWGAQAALAGGRPCGVQRGAPAVTSNT